MKNNNFKNKKLLILGANDETINIINSAKEMGIITVVTDYNINASAKKIANISYDIDCLDIDKICEMAHKEKIDGVLVGVADILVKPYQIICEKLNLPCYANRESSQIFNNKKLFKETCLKYNIKGVPEYSVNNKNEIIYPVIVKPTDGNSGKGITLVRNENELNNAIITACENSKSKTYIIEKYMECDDVSIYYTIVDGNPYLSLISDRYTLRSNNSSTPLCIGDIFPSKHYENFINYEHPKYVKMLHDVGVKNGILYVSAFYDNKNFYVYDPGFRLQGGGFHLILKYVNKIDQCKMLINFALTGSMNNYNLNNLNDPKMNNNYAAVIWFLLKPGIIKNIYGIDYINKHPCVDYAIQRFNIGDEITEQMQGTERQVFLRLFMHCKNKEELKNVINDCQNRVKVLSETGENIVLPTLTDSFENKFYTVTKMLKNKVIVISGGTKGVGRELALNCAASGAKVIISGRDEQTAMDIINEASKFNGEIYFKQTDLHNISEINNLFDFVKNKYGILDGYVNYAGVTVPSTLTDATEEHFDEIFNIDIKAAFFCCQSAIKLMQKNGGGSIVLIGSTHHIRGNKDRAAYACAKGALLTLSNHIGKHYACDNIRCNYLVMGWTPTDGELALRKSQNISENELHKMAASIIPLGRMTESSDIIPGVIYLLSDYSSMLTATEFKINGGEII